MILVIPPWNYWYLKDISIRALLLSLEIEVMGNLKDQHFMHYYDTEGQMLQSFLFTNRKSQRIFVQEL